MKKRGTFMIYDKQNRLLIRTILPTDPKIICAGEIAQGWHQTEDKYLQRLADNASGKSISLIAEYEGHAAGYINVYPDADNGPFKGSGYPEIVDFGVLEKYRCRGIGSRLMDIAEEIAAGYADTVYLAVGLHSGYGSAQRMYVKRGYIPDGSGAWYGNSQAAPYKTYCNDDDLMLYLSKPVRAGKDI